MGNFRQIHELWLKVEAMKSENRPKEEIDGVMRTLGQKALEEEEIYVMVQVSKELGDVNLLRRAIEIGLKSGKNDYDTLIGCQLVGDLQGIEKIIERASRQGEKYILESAFSGGLSERILQGFMEFKRERGYTESVSFDLPRVFNAAGNIAKDYDVGVGIAKGGLFSSYAFNVMGLPIILAEAHRKGKGATFKWIDSPEKIRDARVLILDKDVVSGRTTRRSLKEIQDYHPRGIDLFLNHDSTKTQSEWSYSHLDSVPEGFRRVYTPIMFNYEKFPKVFKNLNEKFSKN